VRGESVRFDDTENMIIEGDNLEVLKLLQKGYQSKVKMIYIDPPYNTGNDFIYPDDYADNLKNYLQYTGQADLEGKRFSDNLDTDGRFHSKWLNMMYPRLYLARNLLREDGVIFISIDDSEVENCKRVCDEVFGAENQIETFVWKKSYGGGAKEYFAVKQHEYCLLYARNQNELGEFWLPPDPTSEERYYDLRDEKVETRGPYRVKPLEATKSMDARDKLNYPIPAPDGTDVWPKRQWWWSKDRALEALRTNGLVFAKGKDGWTVSYKQYLIDENGKKRGAKPFSVLDKFFTQHGTADMRRIFDDQVVLQFPKPVALIRHFLHFGAAENGLVLDFFAGSGSTGEAVLESNKTEGPVCNFILVQLPEPTEREDYKTIAEITKERVRRVIQRQEKKAEGQLDLLQEGKPDRKEGFRVFKLAPSNFKVWDAHTDEGVEGVERQMELAVNHIMPDRTAEDLFYEILMKSEYPLTAKVENFDAAGIKAFSVEDDALIVCVERKVTAEAVAAIAKRSPSKVIFLDEAFSGNDQLKANAKMNFESAGVKRFETV
jgi:adenine-specific DNA-methyltransferase